MRSMKYETVLIMAGGTGGHVFPALSIAKALKARGVQVHWLGTRSGIEYGLVPEAGYPITYIPAVSLRGATLLQRLVLPVRLLMVLLRTWWVFLKVRPDVVLGMGGYASAPGGVIAWLMRKPLVIHEQNSVPGLTNRILAKLARLRLCAFPEAFTKIVGADAAIMTGNPVRQEILDVEAPEARFKARDDKKLRLLVLGGSQGARPINQVMPDVLAQLADEGFLAVWHQTGKQDHETVVADYQAKVGILGSNDKITPFISDMAEAYAWADIVLCRAGAMTLAELMAAGVGSILVPWPHSADNHQFFNAQYLVGQNGAMLLEQKDLTAELVVGLLRELQFDRSRLLAMAKAARASGHPDAVGEIASAIFSA